MFAFPKLVCLQISVSWDWCKVPNLLLETTDLLTILQNPDSITVKTQSVAFLLCFGGVCIVAEMKSYLN